MTELTLTSHAPKTVQVRVIPVVEADKKPQCLGGDEALQKAVEALVKQNAFKPSQGATWRIQPLAGEQVLLLGLGEKSPKKKPALSPVEQVRRLGGKVMSTLSGLGTVNAVLEIEGVAGTFGLKPEETAEALATGARLANYSYDEHKGKGGKEAKGEKKKSVVLALTGKGAQAGVKRADTVTAFVTSCRDLQATPPNVADPAYMAATALQLAKGKKNLKVTVLNEAELKKKKYVGLLTVGAGSAKESRMIIMDYHPPGAQGTLGLVGKAITFDTGGISLKPGAKMHEMKYDKSGGCAVMHFVALAAAMGLKHRVVGVITAAENMPGGKAARPGDIIKYKNGKTVEILNTDAEGRLVLADGLIEIATHKPDAVVDLATLTGMCVATLGHVAAGLLSDTQGLADALLASGQASGERLWQLPLWEEYHEMIKGEHADIKNIGGPNGGTITAAWFLKNFAPEGTPWAHLDIAGTAWGDFKNPYVPNGPSGFGVRLLLDFLEANGSKLAGFKKENS